MTYTNSAGTYPYTLQPNGTMTHNHIVVTRIGGKPSPAREPAAPPSPAVAARYPEKQVHKNNADSLMAAAHAAANEGSASSLSVAEGNFINAATEYGKAGDFKNERIARANAAKVAKAAQRLEASEPARPSKRLSNNRLANPDTSGPQTNPRKKITKEWLEKVSLKNQIKPRDEKLCAAYRAELGRDTKQSPAYTAELTAAVKGACN